MLLSLGLPRTILMTVYIMPLQNAAQQYGIPKSIRWVPNVCLLLILSAEEQRIVDYAVHKGITDAPVAESVPILL